MEALQIQISCKSAESVEVLVTEGVSHVAVAAHESVDAITVTRKLMAPTLQRGEPHGEQQGQFTSPDTI